MHELAGCTVLLVEDDDDSRYLLGEGLSRLGARVVEAASGPAALACLDVVRPDIVVSDLGLGCMHGAEMLQAMRARPGLDALPAIALTGHATQAERDLAFRAGFAKHLLKPAKIVDLVAAIVALRPSSASHGIRELLAELNKLSPCRFTSLLRFAEDDTLASVWTYDRENPSVDAFPLGLPIYASYCVLIRTSRATCAIENAAFDPRATGHPKREELAAYIGVPLLRPDGEMFGTLCSYDAQPVTFDETVRDTLEKATHDLEARMSWFLSPQP